MNPHWRIHIDLEESPSGEQGEEFYLDATDFDLESLLDEPERMKAAVLRLMNVPFEEGADLDERLRATVRDRGDALLQRLFIDDCINASVTFSEQPGYPEFEYSEEPVSGQERQLLMVKHGVEFGRIRRAAA